MIDMHGTRDSATASSSSRTPGERYCGSCIASAIRSYSDGLTAPGPSADRRPGSLRVSISTGADRPLIGMRTWAPSELIASTSAGRQTSFTLLPANSSFAASRDP